jgi:hypothetical protein
VSIDMMGALAILAGLTGAAILWLGLRWSYLTLRLTGVAVMLVAIGGLLLGATPRNTAGISPLAALADAETLRRIPGLAAQLDSFGPGGTGGLASSPGDTFTILGVDIPLPSQTPGSPSIRPPGEPGPKPPPDPDPELKNRAPVAVDDFAVTTEDDSVSIDVLANDSDPDGDSLSVTDLTNPPHGSVVNDGGGTVTYTPEAGYAGSDSFVYDACDSKGLCDQATVSLTVNAVNDAPDADGDSATTNEDDSVTVDVLANDSDPDGDSLSVSGLSDPSNGSVANNGDGTVTYTPNGGFAGSDSFTYDACDPGGLCDQATVTITVTAVNDAPDADGDSATTAMDTPVTIDVLANDSDPDGDSLSVSNLSDPPNGSVVDDGGGSVTYTPDLGFVGDDSFTYDACDPGGLCDQATVTVTVTGGLRPI